MAYAIIETCGKQLRVEPGRFYDVDRLPYDTDETVEIDQVLLLNDDSIQVGQPYVPGVVVQGTVLEHRRGPKLIVYKMRPKKKTRKKQGHRQELTRLLITGISVNGKIIGEVSTPTSEPVDSPTTTSEEE
ncbi:50S ribosomal protein L21 [Candidatus Synechococcus calcipolaris G9]|uniref:Large ribosomal subunit protein bL21 n=1 Tax=Candidatus Synechococcus calcipolaris G9 TaxID=1497997 RepID=A0ABT6EZY3_9SYNE|nr:50S ribosomal protein L21 [Candidatus Synechococcus calcipolaris]MDG2991132.1 50S ribosomal protein L21 [Candidatus Synechococcus calcipolaris G9]